MTRTLIPQAEQIYQVYPRKVGKPAALPKIISGIIKHGFDVVKERTVAYAERVRMVGQPMALIPHPSTFFHQERFMDDLEAALPLPANVIKGPPVWQKLKNTQALLESNKKELLRAHLPNQLQYEWVNGKNEKYDRDFRIAQLKRTKLKENIAALEKQLVELQREAACV